jgi:hypothetical protein
VRDERDRVSDWLVERLKAGDLPARVGAEVRSRLEAGGSLARLDELEASDRSILAAHPPAEVAREIERRLALLESRSKSRVRLALVVPGAAIGAVVAVASVLLMLGPGSGGHGGGQTSSGEITTLKGLEPRLLIYRKTASGADVLGASSPVHARDMLQVAYIGAGRRFGVIASVDGAGTVTLHLPEQPGAASPLEGQGEVRLSHSFELDETPGVERFVFVTGNHSFSTDVVVEALRTPERRLPHDLAISELALRKTDR